MASSKIHNDDEQDCPICLRGFNLPRQLPCAHTFCQHCLQSYISTEASKDKKLSSIRCPVCRQIANPATQNKPTSEWASLFPSNTVLQSILPTKSKVDRLCGACSSEGVSIQAEGFCAICKEAMCGDCVKFHKKQKLSKNHAVVKIEDLTDNMENAMKCAEGFTCSDHDGEDIKFYCKDHKFACCAFCYFHSHKTCSQMIDLKEELSTLLSEIRPEDIIEELTKIKTHLIKFMEVNESNVSDLQSQVNELTDQIRAVRNKINAVLDDFEKKVNTEGCRIYKEEAIKKQEENHKCLALFHAVRNSHFLFETVNKYGSDIQRFLMTEKIKSQLPPYYIQIRENYVVSNKITVVLEFSPLMASISSLSSSEVGQILSNTLPVSIRKPTKDCQVERVDAIDVESPGGNRPGYVAITFLPGDKVMLADWTNEQCILLNPSYKFIASYKLTGKPTDICVVDDQDVAFTIPSQNKIQILSVRNDVISQVSLITTTNQCSGIADAGKGNMFVTGDCGDNNYQLSLITMGGEVKSIFQYDCPSKHWHYLGLDSSRTRIYISEPGNNSLLCFNMDGKKLFTYSPESLRWPLVIQVDRDDNIYIVGKDSNNIHRLSPYGSLQQLIMNGVPNYPTTICYNRERDVFLVTSLLEAEKLYVYQLK